ncbi:hypothetical protein [Streptomyces liangshanensis]|uniref:hypothetical protein n=1 Tax=Streptomyces liangshanensis TaxID=2717324 RepID=UPI0036DBDCBE
MPPTATPTAAAPAPTARVRIRVRAAPALLAYLGVRLLGLLVLARWARLRGHGVWPTLAGSWDSRWYLRIADHGYATALGTEMDSNSLAFFPLYPGLVKAVAAVTPGSRASVALVLAAGFSLVAAWGIFAVGDLLHGPRTGVVLVVLWAALPVAVVQWMAYTESLFTALTAWALYWALRERWVAAGACAALAGLTRPTGIAVGVAVAVVAGVAWWRTRERDAWIGALLAPAGWLAFVAWVGWRVGRWDGYFAVQRLWRNQWDGGADTVRELRHLLAYQTRPQLFLVVVSGVLLASAALYVVCAADRQPWVLLVFTGVLLVVVLGSGGVYFPRARFLLPGFPLLLPVAVAVARTRRPVAWVVVSSAVVASAWFGAYTLLVWRGPP